MWTDRGVVFVLARSVLQSSRWQWFTRVRQRKTPVSVEDAAVFRIDSPDDRLIIPGKIHLGQTFWQIFMVDSIFMFSWPDFCDFWAELNTTSVLALKKAEVDAFSSGNETKPNKVLHDGHQRPLHVTLFIYFWSQ